MLKRLEQWSHDNHHNDTRLNDTQHIDTQHYDTQHIDTQHIDTQDNDTGQNDPRHKSELCTGADHIKFFGINLLTLFL